MNIYTRQLRLEKTVLRLQAETTKGKRPAVAGPLEHLDHIRAMAEAMGVDLSRVVFQEIEVN